MSLGNEEKGVKLDLEDPHLRVKEREREKAKGMEREVKEDTQARNQVKNPLRQGLPHQSHVLVMQKQSCKIFIYWLIDCLFKFYSFIYLLYIFKFQC